MRRPGHALGVCTRRAGTPGARRAGNALNQFTKCAPTARRFAAVQERVRADITEWLQYLRTVGFDGWRFDFVRGYSGQYIKQYIDATVRARRRRRQGQLGRLCGCRPPFLHPPTGCAAGAPALARLSARLLAPTPPPPTPGARHGVW